MPSELKRGAIRILSNYVRLFALLLIGILFVPTFIYGIGIEAFGIFGLLGASVSIAEMCKAIVRESMIRELGSAYHSEDPVAFAHVYNSAIVLSAAAAMLSAALYGAVFLLFPVLDIPDNLRVAAMWMLLAKGLLSIVVIVTSPQFNMYRITERMVLYNLWTTLNRATDLLVAIVLFLLLNIHDPATGLMLFGFLSAGSSGAIVIFAVVMMFRLEPRLMPDFSVVNRSSIRELLRTSGWNSVVVTATHLHITLDQFIMNFAFGAIGNSIFTLGVRLTGYVWQLAGATTDGVDAVAARISSTDRGRRGIADMLFHTTRLQAVITVPACLIVIVMADPLMVLWVGRATDNPEVISKAVLVAQILTVGMLAKGISHVWMRVLYGAGYVRVYAPLVLCAGVLNPVVAVLFILLLPASVNYIGPSLAFTIMFLAFHFMLLPMIIARCMEISVREVLQPLVRPSIATLICSPSLMIPYWLGASRSPLVLLAALAVFGAIWLPLVWWYILHPEDRKRLGDGIRRRLWRLNKPQRREAATDGALCPSPGGIDDENLDEEQFDPHPLRRER